jgi:hypothetical protein
VIIGPKEDSPMIETFERTPNLPGAFVLVDPHLEALLAIDLLDEEPDATRWIPEPPRFPHAEARTEERIPVLAG